MKNLQEAAAGGAAATLPTKTKQNKIEKCQKFSLRGRKQRFEVEKTIFKTYGLFKKILETFKVSFYAVQIH